MTTDAETILAIVEANAELAKEIAGHIESVAQEGRAGILSIRTRIDDHEKLEMGVINDVTNTLTGLQAEINGEKDRTALEIIRLEKLIAANAELAKDNQGKLWKVLLWLLGLVGVGGGGAWFSGGSG